MRKAVELGVKMIKAMISSSHKTRSLFNRYHMINVTAVKDTAKKQYVYLKFSMVTADAIRATMYHLNKKRGNHKND